MALTYEKLKNELLTARKKEGLQKCAQCHTSLQKTITGNTKTAKGYVCNDCYFDLFGKGLEKNPIIMPRSIHKI